MIQQVHGTWDLRPRFKLSILGGRMLKDCFMQGSNLIMALESKLFPSSFLSAFLLMDFNTPHFYSYYCFLIGTLTTSGTHGTSLLRLIQHIEGNNESNDTILRNQFQYDFDQCPLVH